MRVLSQEEFVKKIERVCSNVTRHQPMLEVRANWQLRLQYVDEQSDVRQFLGPNPAEMDSDDYTVFLSEVDIHAKSTMAVSFCQDRTPIQGGQ
jgi:hypothetical protein